MSGSLQLGKWFVTGNVNMLGSLLAAFTDTSDGDVSSVNTLEPDVGKISTPVT